jgi:hypothetical protein
MHRVWWTALLLVLAVVAGMLWAGGWLPARIVPQKIIVRGCVLTAPEEVLLKLGCTRPASYFSLLRRVRSLDTTNERWLSGVWLCLVSSRTALLTVHERKPLLRLTGGSAKYWLCDDGCLVRMDVQADHGGVFDAVRSLPSVELPSGAEQVTAQDAEQLFTAAACCQEALPGLIDRVVLDQSGMLHLYDRKGFRIYLGPSDALREKIAVLPKALRVCAADRAKLKYLDASNPRVFYQVWKEPLS